jgi:hypothetical protein
LIEQEEIIPGGQAAATVYVPRNEREETLRAPTGKLRNKEWKCSPNNTQIPVENLPCVYTI